MGVTLSYSGLGGKLKFSGTSGRFKTNFYIPLLLDIYANAAGAYSLRKLSKTYSGAAIRVRRSSDNAETNIGFVNNDLDMASLLTFCGVGNGFVTTWYDQSGNARNLTQASTSLQPTIVTSGLIESFNGKPVIYYALSQNLSINYGFPGANSFIFDVIKTADLIFVMYHGGSGGFDYASAGQIGEASTSINGTVTVNAYYKNSVLQSPTTRGQIYNMVSTNSQNIITQKLTIPAWSTFSTSGYTTFEFSHYKSELLIYNTDQTSNRSAIESNVISYYSINRQPSGNNLLDLYPVAAGAYSLRKLRSAYTGNAIRVRRSNDNVEQNIGFLGSDLDTASLISFVGSNSGLVTTWYDQSGNNRNLTQATLIKQPNIIISGSLQISNSKPAIYFNNSGSTIGTSYGFANATYFFDVLKTNDTNFVFYSDGFTNSYTIVGTQGNTSADINGNAPISAIYKNSVLQSPTTRGQAYTMISTNNQILLTTNTAVSFNWTSFYIGGYPNGYDFEQYKSELVIYDSEQTANQANIQNNINSYYTIY